MKEKKEQFRGFKESKLEKIKQVGINKEKSEKNEKKWFLIIVKYKMSEANREMSEVISMMKQAELYDLISISLR